VPQKGETLSEEVKQKQNESKRLTFLSKMQWELCEPYLDVEINSGTTKNGNISFRQFRDRIINGSTLRQMRKSGICKHIIQFIFVRAK
jgi:hypothetical protein